MISLSDTTRGVKWREEDMRHRKMMYRQFMITQKDRLVDLRANGLNVISNHSALMAGFTIVMFVELTLPEGLPTGLVVAYGATSAAVCCILSLTMIQTMLVMNAMNQRSQMLEDKMEFNRFWVGRCDEKWRRTFKWFSFAVPLFLLDIALVGWIKFYDTPSAAVVVTVMSVVSIVVWALDQCFWGTYISSVLEFKDNSVFEKGAGFEMENRQTSPRGRVGSSGGDANMLSTGPSGGMGDGVGSDGNNGDDAGRGGNLTDNMNGASRLVAEFGSSGEGKDAANLV